MRILAATLLFVLPAASHSATSAFEQLLAAAPSSAVESARSHGPGLPIPGRALPGRDPVKGIGISHSGDPHDIPDFSPREMARMMRQGGSTHYRPHLPLNEPLREITPAQMRRLDDAQDDPILMDVMVDDLLGTADWSKMDELVEAFSDEKIQLILVVGAGYKKEAPLYTDMFGLKRRISPDRLGRKKYLAVMRWIVGAQVRRYGDRVRFWQIENEINVAYTTAMTVKWRVRETSWRDLKFLTRLMQTLGDIVHEEGRNMGRDLKTTHNFLAGIPWAPYRKFVDKGIDRPASGLFSRESRDYLDIVGIDAYSNYYQGWPHLDKIIGRQVLQANKMAKGRPVWILESGVANAPRVRGFSHRRQAEYFGKMFDQAYHNGADMVLAFGWFWNPRGWFNDRTDRLPWWHPQAVEQYWSPIMVDRTADGGKKVKYGRAWAEIGKAAARWLKR